MAENNQSPVDQLLERARDIQGAVQGVDFHAAYQVVKDGTRNLLIGEYGRRPANPRGPIHLPNGGQISSNLFGRGALAASLIVGAQAGMGLFNGIVNRFGDDSVLKQRMDTDGERTKFALGAAGVGMGVFGAAGLYSGMFHARKFTGHPEKYRKALASVYGGFREWEIGEDYRALRGRVGAHNAQIYEQFGLPTAQAPLVGNAGTRQVTSYHEVVPGSVPRGYSQGPHRVGDIVDSPELQRAKELIRTGKSRRTRTRTRTPKAGFDSQLEQFMDSIPQPTKAPAPRRWQPGEPMGKPFVAQPLPKPVTNTKVSGRARAGIHSVINDDELVQAVSEESEKIRNAQVARARAEAAEALKNRGRRRGPRPLRQATVPADIVTHTLTPQSVASARGVRPGLVRTQPGWGVRPSTVIPDDIRGLDISRPGIVRGTTRHRGWGVRRGATAGQVDYARRGLSDQPILDELGVLDLEAMGLNNPMPVLDDITTRVNQAGEVVRGTTGGADRYGLELASINNRAEGAGRTAASIARNAIVPETYGANFAVGAALGIGAFGAGLAKGAFDVAMTSIGTVAGLGLLAGQALQKGLFHGTIPGETSARQLTFSEAMMHPQAWTNRAKVFAAGTAVVSAIKHAYDVSGSNKRTRDSVRGISFREARTPGDLGATGNIALNAYYNQKSVWS